MNNEKKDTTFKAYVPASEKEINQITSLARQSNLTIQPEASTPSWFMALTSLIPFVLMFLLLFFLMNRPRGGGQMMNVGKSKARLYKIVIRLHMKLALRCRKLLKGSIHIVRNC
ncbi:MAG: hypothetical protein ACE3JK_15130 [Sporolactobacillus sp.]